MTVQRRLTVGFLAVLGVLLASLAALELVEVRGFLYDAAGVRVRAQAKPIIDAAVAQPGTELVELAGQLATDLTSADTGALVVAPDGTVLGRPAAGTIGADPPSAAPSDALARAVAGDREVDIVRDGPGGRELVALVPLPPDPRPRAVIVLATGLAEEDGVVRRQLVLAVAALAVLLIAGWGVGTLLIRQALRPLRDIATATRGIAAGDLGLRVDGRGPDDEIGELSRSVNEMAASLERAFSEVSASEARIREFVADASHELRTPLTALGGFVDVLVRNANDADPTVTARLLVGLRREVGRMQRLVDDLLLLARLDAGSGIAPRSIDLAEVTRAAVDAAEMLAGGRRLELLAPRPVPVDADPDRLQQVVLNLLTNAVRHTGANGLIQVNVFGAGGDAVLEVLDNGEGMNEATQKSAFGRFRRNEQGGGGAGLGLAIVAGIVAGHDGQIELESSPGHGTRVSVRLPADGSQVVALRKT